MKPRTQRRMARLRFEREFLKLAGTMLACRLALMGGTPDHRLHVPVQDWESLDWALLGMTDYEDEMQHVCTDRRKSLLTPHRLL